MKVNNNHILAAIFFIFLLVIVGENWTNGWLQAIAWIAWVIGAGAVVYMFLTKGKRGK